MKIIIVIQARLNSSRLPNKVVQNIGSRRLIDWVLDYCVASVADRVVLAVPDLQLTAFRGLLGGRDSVDVYGGSEDNVASRFIDVGTKVKADYLVRITCDDPFKPVCLLNSIIQLCRLNVYDYISNNRSLVFPEGFDIEAFKLNALIDSVKNDCSPHNLEHVTSYLRKSEKYKKLWLESNVSYKRMRCTIDVKDDIKVASNIIRSNGDACLESIISYFKSNSVKLEEYLKNNRSEYYK